MITIGTLIDILLFYTIERVLFNRMVISIGLNARLVKRVIAIWLLLEEMGYHDLTRKIESFDNLTIISLFDETLEYLEYINPFAVEPPESDDSLVFVGLFYEPMNKRFFYENREFLNKRFLHIMETVCNNIFGETAAVEVDESGNRPAVRSFGEGTSAQGAARIAEASTSGVGARSTRGITMSRELTLNPDATEFFPGQAPEDNRTMFLTFSVGFPLSRLEIIQFFTSNWGPVVEEVVMGQPRAGCPPLYGRIIFKTPLIIPIILDGEARAKFVVNNKHLWARVYQPRCKRPRRGIELKG